MVLAYPLLQAFALFFFFFKYTITFQASRSELRIMLNKLERLPTDSPVSFHMDEHACNFPLVFSSFFPCYEKW